MSRGPENTFIDSVHRHLPKNVYHMKNHNEYIGGVFDVWYDGPRADLWVEYKFIVVPKRDNTIIDLCGGKDPILSKLQQQWGDDRAANGRDVAVIVGCKDGGVWLGPDQWTEQITAAEFRRCLYTRAKLAELIRLYTRG